MLRPSPSPRVPESSAGDRSLARDAELVVAAVYEREVASDLEGVWENVYDWEHLPWLHDQAFTSIRLIESGDWGWCAEIGFPGGEQSIVELVADRNQGCYVARTIEGSGAPSEIWTSLRSAESALPANPAQEGAKGGAEPSTQIRVEFCVPPLAKETMALIGKTYLAVYAELWDQDEEMMQTRANRNRRRLGQRGSQESLQPHAPSHPASLSIDLGLASDLRKRVPIRFDFGGHAYRLLEQEGQFLAHSAECPHWGGPLLECEVKKGEMTCPWHGYRFGVEDGRSTDGRHLRLRPAPRIVLDATTGRLTATK